MDDGGSMGPETSGVLQGDGGVSPEGAVQADTPAAEPKPYGGLSPEELERIPPEFRPDKDGKYPAITPKLIRAMRGKYFTVTHARLEACGHRFDLVNEPRNNCELCWINFFAYHPQLVETADQFFRTHGREPLIGMRGKKFVRFFTRYMSTLYREQQEREKATSVNTQTTEDADLQQNSSATNQS